MPGKVAGKVVEVDAAGNLVTDITSQQLADAPHDESLRVIVDEHETFGLYGPDHTQPAMTLVAIIGPDQPLSIVLVGDSASAMLGVRVGAPVVVEW
ncbi:MAG: adenosylmethionine-8-amino-7-oxononanoate aminotransferase [Planctomycetota bacterium]|nr:MAG: adenosylmethionine-8-amino-7-oxononanoate aminotransferase [Planctomycetota bacterium]